MTYSKAIEFLYGLRWFGTKLGLENTRQLAALAGSPHERLRFIHVAGTNGKGSTCAILESIYRAAGRRVGLFTSPHLVAFGERIQVDRQLISEAEVVRQVAELQPLLRTFPPEGHPTFFEVVTVMALRHFAEQRCDLVVWETGLGGRLDATNIVTPLASVITNVQYDHQQWLGHTLAEIASEKAGIIKPGVPVVTAAEPGAAREVIASTARRLDAPLTLVDRADTALPPLDQLTLPLRGDHQKLNAAVALATVRALADQLPVGEAALLEGLARVHWPGRLQSLTTATGQAVLLDGAHNLAGVDALVRELTAQFPDREPTLVFGVLRDKDWPGMSARLAARSRRIHLVPVAAERGLPPEELLPVCRQANPQATIRCHRSLAEALNESARDPFVLVTGSLYLVGEALELLRALTPPATPERALNEWDPLPRAR